MYSDWLDRLSLFPKLYLFFTEVPSFYIGYTYLVYYTCIMKLLSVELLQSAFPLLYFQVYQVAAFKSKQQTGYLAWCFALVV